MIGRRSFLAGILGAAAAPAIVKAESLMMGRSVTVWKSRSVGPSTTLLYTGELGVIDDAITFTAKGSYAGTLSPTAAEHAAREMLRICQPVLMAPLIGRPGVLSPQSSKTIRFRRPGGSTLFVPSTPLHDLLHGDRKTA